VHSVHGDVILSGNVIQGNTVSGVNGDKGGGLYVFYSKATLINNIIIGNRISGIHSGGGGVYLEGWWRPALLSRNLICGNIAQGRGGGLFLFANAATVSGNSILSNVAEEGGGVVLMTDSNATLVNNIVANNQAHTTGSGVYVAGSKPCFLHTTIAHNTDGEGSGVYVTTDGFLHYSTVSLTNTIIAGHHNLGVTVTTGSTATLEATLWYDNGLHTGGGGTIVTGTVNVYDDPVFVDSSAWDYHLTAGSAAIDEGVNAGVDEDIDSDPRPIGVGYDIGADEYAVHAYLPIVLSNYGP
jgi:hypothetical protein